MEATELRIGNHITDDTGEIYTVKGIKERSYAAGGYIIRVNHGQTKAIAIEIAKPILVTEELLLKFGFETAYEFRKQCYWRGTYEIVLWFFKNGRIDLRLSAIDFKDHERKVKRYKYVHQLQNLHFALTGKELKP